MNTNKTDYSSIISICIPTYNRSEILKECLKDTIYKVQKYSLPIIVSDNNSSDNTSELVMNLKKEYPYIIYYKHSENIGVDRNFEFCLKQSKTSYCWLLGDSYRIEEDQLDNILHLAKLDKYSVILTNSFDNVQGIPSSEYSNSDKLLYDLGWHITLMCTLIYSSRIIENALFYRYYNTHFIQNGIIFEYLSKNKNELVYWHDSICTNKTNISKETTSWAPHTWDIFGVCWTNYILSLPFDITLETKLKCIKEHGKNTHYFTYAHIKEFKLKGYLTLSDLKRYKTHRKYFCQVPYPLICLILLMPNWLLKTITIIWKYLHS